MCHWTVPEWNSLTRPDIITTPNRDTSFRWDKNLLILIINNKSNILRFCNNRPLHRKSYWDSKDMKILHQIRGHSGLSFKLSSFGTKSKIVSVFKYPLLPSLFCITYCALVRMIIILVFFFLINKMRYYMYVCLYSFEFIVVCLRTHKKVSLSPCGIECLLDLF